MASSATHRHPASNAAAAHGSAGQHPVLHQHRVRLGLKGQSLFRTAMRVCDEVAERHRREPAALASVVGTWRDSARTAKLWAMKELLVTDPTTKEKRVRTQREREHLVQLVLSAGERDLAASDGHKVEMRKKKYLERLVEFLRQPAASIWGTSTNADKCFLRWVEDFNSRWKEVWNPLARKQQNKAPLTASQPSGPEAQAEAEAAEAALQQQEEAADDIDQASSRNAASVAVRTKLWTPLSVPYYIGAPSGQHIKSKMPKEAVYLDGRAFGHTNYVWGGSRQESILCYAVRHHCPCVPLLVAQTLRLGFLGGNNDSTMAGTAARAAPLTAAFYRDVGEDALEDAAYGAGDGDEGYRGQSGVGNRGSRVAMGESPQQQRRGDDAAGLGVHLHHRRYHDRADRRRRDEGGDVIDPVENPGVASDIYARRHHHHHRRHGDHRHHHRAREGNAAHRDDFIHRGVAGAAGGHGMSVAFAGAESGSDGEFSIGSR